ncbi:MAG TPA: hypothetical protein VE090_03990 [Methylomirabilota bacterium]|nr:hypothetical protein [Methylomirabilota bacterium]
MKKLFNHFRTDKIIRWSFSFAGVLLLTEVFSTAFFYTSLPSLVPLFNQLSWGEERLGIKIEIFLPSFIVLLFLLCNFFLINYLYEKMPLVSRMVCITTLLISILSFIFTIQTLHIIL